MVGYQPSGTMYPTDHVTPWDHVPPGPCTFPPEPCTPSTEHAGRYGQRRGGTHPTGMQSCLHIITQVITQKQTLNDLITSQLIN